MPAGEPTPSAQPVDELGRPDFEELALHKYIGVKLVDREQRHLGCTFVVTPAIEGREGQLNGGVLSVVKRNGVWTVALNYALVAVSQLMESLQHANLKLGFGPLEYLLVSPRFHRLHHSIGIGHESSGPGTLGGHNFAVLFPVWDIIFGTANFESRWDATGVRDQLPAEGGRDYGRGFWQQQWLGLRRLLS